MMLLLSLCISLLSGSVWGAILRASPCSSNQLGNNTLDRALAEVARNESNVDHTLLLDSGEHCIWNFSLVRDVEELSIVGNGSVTIKCAPGVGLAFYNTTRLTLANLVIDGCGMKLEYIHQFLSAVKETVEFFLDVSNKSDQFVSIALGSCVDLKMEDSKVINTQGLGLLAVNLIGYSNLTNNSFENNVASGCFQFRTPSEYVELERVGGGAIFAYLDYIEITHDSVSYLNITNSVFYGNSYCGFSSYYSIFSEKGNQVFNQYIGGAGGLSVVLSQLNYKVSAEIQESVFQNNTGVFGGGAYVAIYTGVFGSSVQFQGSTFDSNGVAVSFIQTLNYPVQGTALSIFSDFVQPDFRVNGLKSSPSKLLVIDCMFVNNTAYNGVVILYSLYNLVIPEKDRSGLQVLFKKCIFYRNKAVYGPVLLAVEFKGEAIQHGTKITLEDIHAENNEVLLPLTSVQSTTTAGVIHLNKINLTLTGDSILKHNSGSAIKSSSCYIYFQGQVTFLNNTATYGGGMNLDRSSVIAVLPNTSVIFSDNTAVIDGGAIHVDQTTSSPELYYSRCFLYFDNYFLCATLGGEYCGDVTKMGVSIIFERNTALIGGMIYGSTLERCPWAIEFNKMYSPGVSFVEKSLFQTFYEEVNFTSPFKFDRAPNDATAVATAAVQLIAMGTGPLENTSISNLTVAPGIETRIQLSAIDEFGQLAPTVLSHRSITEGTVFSLSSLYTFINFNATEEISFTVSTTASDPTNETASVSLFTIGSISQLVFNISFAACPSGFYWNQTQNNCTCLDGLGRYRVTCTPEGGLIVPLNTWVGTDDYETAQVVMCSFDFCSRRIIDISTTPLAEQCNENYNRAGPGCGGCVDGYSLALGSNRCRRCSNAYIMLLLTFAFLGVLLMTVMLLLRISIAGGLLNGVLYFSNIVSLYSPLFSQYFIFIFFWFSLKLGLESCFFDGMKPIHVAALNFVFPLYLYLLVFVIVMIARQSTKFSDFLFRTKASPAKLFATILVMTYSSLLESCIQILSYTTLHNITVNGTETSNRWRIDPSQRYFHGGHGALSMLAIILLVFFLIPAPILWMFPARIFSIKILRRYKPIYDAVWAPLKPRYLFWVSLRLLYRIPPLLFVNFIPVPENLLCLSLFLVITLFIHGMVQPFQGMAQNAFDGFLQLLLIILSTASLYFSRAVEGVVRRDINALNTEVDFLYDVQNIVTPVLFAIAFLTFVNIFVWHVVETFDGPKKCAMKWWRKIKLCHANEFKENDEEIKVGAPDEVNESIGSLHSTTVEVTPTTSPTVATFTELREPLLDDIPIEIVNHKPMKKL